MGKIIDWIKNQGIYYLLMIIAFGSTCVGTIGSGNGGNYQDVRMKANFRSHEVAKVCMPDAETDREEEGIVSYVATFEERDVAEDKFIQIIRKIEEVHVREKIKAKYSNASEKYFVCYGDEMSIIVTFRKYAISKHDFTFYSVRMEYVDTDTYDWEYLDRRIN